MIQGYKLDYFRRNSVEINSLGNKVISTNFLSNLLLFSSILWFALVGIVCAFCYYYFRWKPVRIKLFSSEFFVINNIILRELSPSELGYFLVVLNFSLYQIKTP